MPSAKPDWNEISRLKNKRNLYVPDVNLFYDIYDACRSTLDGGYVTKERADKLLTFLRTHDNIAAIFPNNLLYKILCFICKEKNWSSESENLLLSFIGRFYLDCDRENQTVYGTAADEREHIMPPDINIHLMELLNKNERFSLIAKDILFNQPPENINFHERFVGFTGSFNGYTRKTCFEEIRKHGGVPCEPQYFTDYFFVASKLIEQNSVSGQFRLAIYFRCIYGKPLIFKEESWHEILCTHNT